MSKGCPFGHFLRESHRFGYGILIQLGHGSFECEQDGSMSGGFVHVKFFIEEVEEIEDDDDVQSVFTNIA